jgi:hypothetical protein
VVPRDPELRPPREEELHQLPLLPQLKLHQLSQPHRRLLPEDQQRRLAPRDQPRRLQEEHDLHYLNDILCAIICL